jgi:uncharacterized membrane protein (UPF0136 family)
MKNIMGRFDNLITGYSLLLLIGGTTGYFIAGSIASLLMSSIFAILLIGSLFLIRFYPEKGYKTVFALLCALSLFFAYRWASVKFMPSGLLCILTLGVLWTAYNWRTKTI